MKEWIIVALVFIFLYGLPFSHHDTGKLLPIRCVQAQREGELIHILSEAGEGYGKNWKEAVQDLKAGTDGVKFHLLHVIENTDLAEDFKNGKFECLSLEEYADILKACIDILPEDTVVHRITGDGDKKSLIAPLWSADKKKVLNYLHNFLTKNN